jgi:RimJ/RimL family protein N-acetyltransferase
MSWFEQHCGWDASGLRDPGAQRLRPDHRLYRRAARHRGNGYVDDILAEGTRILAGQDAPRIRASTDLGNTPMANAFERAGYVNFEREITMTWS